MYGRTVQLLVLLLETGARGGRQQLNDGDAKCAGLAENDFLLV